MPGKRYKISKRNCTSPGCGLTNIKSFTCGMRKIQFIFK